MIDQALTISGIITSPDEVLGTDRTVSLEIFKGNTDEVEEVRMGKSAEREKRSKVGKSLSYGRSRNDVGVEFIYLCV